MSEAQIDMATTTGTNLVADESDVVERYMNTISAICLPIASTISLWPTSAKWGGKHLTWTTSANTEGYAIADGVLRLASMDTERKSEVERNLGAQAFSCLLELEHKVLATWEIKSLTVGDEDVMEEIHRKAVWRESFNWLQCPGKCRDKNHGAYLSENVEPDPDAKHPPWKLPMETNTPQSQESQQPHGQDMSEAANPTTDDDSPASEAKGKAKRKSELDPDADVGELRTERRYVNANSYLQQVRHTSNPNRSKI